MSGTTRISPEEDSTWSPTTPAERNRRYRSHLKGETPPPLQPKPTRKVVRSCAMCGKPFETWPSRTKNLYCSYSCVWASKVGAVGTVPKKPRKPCPTCGKIVDGLTHKFCSFDCYVQSRITRDRPCEICGQVFRAHRKSARFCSRKCTGVFNQRNEGQGPVGRDGYRGSDWLKVAAVVRERDGNKCRNCSAEWAGGKRWPVDHIRPWRLFTSLGEANNLDNLATLCPSCHSRKTHKIEREALAGDWTHLIKWEQAIHRTAKPLDSGDE
jgi:hypothetical protein